MILDTHQPARVMEINAVQLLTLTPKVKITWGPSNEEVTYTLYKIEYVPLNERTEVTRVKSDDNGVDVRTRPDIPEIPCPFRLIKVAENLQTREYIDTNVQVGGTYIYYVVPVDYAGNRGSFSPPARVTVINIYSPTPEGTSTISEDLNVPSGIA